MAQTTWIATIYLPNGDTEIHEVSRIENSDGARVELWTTAGERITVFHAPVIIREN